MHNKLLLVLSLVTIKLKAFELADNQLTTTAGLPLQSCGALTMCTYTYT